MKSKIRRACDRVAMASTKTARTTSRMQTRLSSEDPGDNEPSTSAKRDPTPAESMSGSPDSHKGSKGGLEGKSLREVVPAEPLVVRHRLQSQMKMMKMTVQRRRPAPTLLSSRGY